MAYEEFEAIPRGIETPNVYGPADKALTVTESCMVGSSRKNDKVFLQDLIWTSQPQQAVDIDWSYKPIFLFLGSTKTDAVTGNILAQSNASHIATVLPLSAGLCISPGGGSPFASGMGARPSSAFIFNVGNSIVWVGVIRQVDATYSTIVSRFSSSVESATYAGQWRLEISPSNEIRLAIRSDSGTTTTINSGLSVTTGAISHITVSMLESSVEFSLNGVRTSAAAAPQTSAGSGGNNANINVGSSIATYNAHRYASTSVVYGVSTVPPANPWQIFKPIPTKLKHFIPQRQLLPSKVGVPGLLEQSKRPWTSQPQQAVDIDWSYDPVFVWSSIRLNADLAKQLPVTVSASAVRTIGKSGVAYDLGTTTSSVLNIAGAVSPGANFTAVVQFQNTSATTTGILLAGKTHWTIANGFMFESKNNTDTLEINGGSSGTFPTISAPGVGALDGKIRTVAVRYRGTSADVCMDGCFLGTVSLGTAAGTWPSGIGIGNYSVPNGNPPSRQFYMAAVVRKGDPVSLSANPWQIFKPLSYKQFVGKNTLPNIQVYREKLACVNKQGYVVHPNISILKPNRLGQTACVVFLPEFGWLHGGKPLGGIGTKPSVLYDSKYTAIVPVSEYRSQDTFISWAGQSAEPSTTLIVVITPTVASVSSSNVVGFSRASDGNGFIGLRSGDGTSSCWNILSGSSSTSSSVPYTLNKEVTLVIHMVRVASASVKLKLFENGIKLIDNPSGFSNGSYGLSGGITLQGNNAAGCKISLVAALTGERDDKELQSLSQNPWQIFAPVTRRLENRTPVKPQPLLPKYNTWTSQPQIPVTLNNTGVISACLPILSNTGYSARDNRPLRHHYNASAHSLSIMNGLTIFSGSSMYDDVFDYNTSTDTRGNYALFSVFSVASLADRVVVAGASPGDSLYIKVSASGAISFVGDSYVTVSSADGVVGIGMHTVVATLVSINGTGNRILNVYLDGKLVAYSASIYVYTNSYWVGPRIYSSGLHSASTVGVHCCGILRDLNIATELHKNPWQIFKPIKYPARLK